MKHPFIVPFVPGVLFFLLIFMGLPFWISAQQSGTFTDTRDGRDYRMVRVGNRAWMAENLQYVDNGASWIYNDDSVHGRKYGRLYSWGSAVKACPKGWHLPSEKEWSRLILALGPDTAGLIMQSWDTSGRVNPDGSRPLVPAISSLLSGIRHPDGRCLNVSYWGGCWSSTQVNDSVAVNFLFVRKTGAVGMSTNDKQSGFAVRCVKK